MATIQEVNDAIVEYYRRKEARIMSGTDTYLEWLDTRTIEDMLAELGDRFYSLVKGTDGWFADTYNIDHDGVDSGYCDTPQEALKKLLEMLAE